MHCVSPTRSGTVTVRRSHRFWLHNSEKLSEQKKKKKKKKKKRKKRKKTHYCLVSCRSTWADCVKVAGYRWANLSSSKAMHQPLHHQKTQAFAYQEENKQLNIQGNHFWWWRQVTCQNAISDHSLIKFHVSIHSGHVHRGWLRSILFLTFHKQRWGLRDYVIVHTILPPSPVILRIELGGKTKWLPLSFGYHDVMHTVPIEDFKKGWTITR